MNTVVAAERVFAALGAAPTRALVSRGGGAIARRAVGKAGLSRLGADIKTLSLLAVSADDRVKVDVDLRPATNGFPSERWTFRVACVSPQPCPWSVAKVFLRAIAEHHTVVHGAGIRVPTPSHARTEASLVAVGGVSDSARIDFDAMHPHQALQHLRRLYPVTIIGPEIWAALPPLPRLDPMPTIEDLGNCKVLTAWPELCDPRDPAFLRGTVALREWLWPYTIQNPADHIDADPFEYTSF